MTTLGATAGDGEKVRCVVLQVLRSEEALAGRPLESRPDSVELHGRRSSRAHSVDFSHYFGDEESDEEGSEESEDY